MEKISYIAYAVWAIACIVLKIVGLVGWWVATSFLWFPLGAIVCVSCFLFLSIKLGSYFKAKEKTKIPPSCENCIWNIGKKINEDKKCFGEREGFEYGKPCQHYTR